MMFDEIVKKVDEKIKKENLFHKVDEIEAFYSKKVLDTFKKYKVSETDFHGTTGYGYNDTGRDKIDMIFADILDSEKALVRSQFISGTHALTVTFFGLLRPGDKLLSITGMLYDTLDEVIGIKENASSLKAFNINFDYIDLINDDFDYIKIEEYLKKNSVKVVEIQRSRGYSNRSSISLDKIKKVVKLIKSINKNIIIMVDNCYCEFVEDRTPLEIGADLIVGSLIKNLGGGIASNGAYIAGKKDLVDLCGERLTLPGEGRDVGPSQNYNKEFLQGLYLAPKVVANSLKVAVLTSKVLEKLGYDVEPKYNDERVDIVQNIIFGNEKDLIKYCEGIQNASAIDSNSVPIPTEMPGYSDKVIMASGSFTQGSSIEISCDCPIRSPYIAYMQGSLTYEYGKIALMSAISKII